MNAVSKMVLGLCYRPLIFPLLVLPLPDPNSPKNETSKETQAVAGQLLGQT